jgi:hypothetical protein
MPPVRNVSLNWAIYHSVLAPSLRVGGVRITGVSDRLVSALDRVLFDDIPFDLKLGCYAYIRDGIVSDILFEWLL